MSGTQANGAAAARTHPSELIVGLAELEERVVALCCRLGLRDGRALVATEKGLNVIRLLGEHPLTSPDLTGSWEQRLGRIERRESLRRDRQPCRARIDRPGDGRLRGRADQSR